MFTRTSLLALLAAIYAGVAGACAWQVINHTKTSTDKIDELLATYNLQNEGEQALDQFNKKHWFLGTLFAGPIRQGLQLPGKEKSDEALHGDVPQELKQIRAESSQAAWWSWFLLNFSLFYVVSAVAIERTFFARGVIFALTSAAMVSFVIGIFAPAMLVWTTPTIPIETGQLSFVLQHKVRGIAAIIWELLTSQHEIVGGFLLLFSIITPMTKGVLTYFITASKSKELNNRIGNFLHSIGKWSMADVFVAGVLLSIYALKAQQATKSAPCLGLYYFIGYCLLSLSTTELLVHSGLVSGNDEPKTGGRIGWRVISGLFAIAVGFLGISTAFTYQQYTLNQHESLNASDNPSTLNNADLVLPAHK